MPTKRSYGDSVVYRIKRQVPGVGKVNRSLGTSKKGVARELESAIITAAEQGYLDLVRAFVEGDVDAARIREARDRGRLPALQRKVRRQSPPLSEATRRMIELEGAGLADSTQRSYRSSLDRFEEWVDGDPSVREALDADVIKRFKKHRRERVSDSTVSNDLAVVGILCTFAEEQGWIDERPEIDRPRIKERIEYLERDEIPAYLSALRPAFQPLMEFLLFTGLRIGEAQQLQVKDLTLSEHTVQVDESKTEAGEGVRYIGQRAVEVLEDHLMRTARTGGDEVFQIPSSTVRDEHGDARDRIGRPEYRIHDHRHTFAVHMARAGLPLHQLQQQLGHASIDVTMKYARFHPEYRDFGEYFDRMEARLSAGADEDVSPATTTA